METGLMLCGSIHGVRECWTWLVAVGDAWQLEMRGS